MSRFEHHVGETDVVPGHSWPVYEAQRQAVLVAKQAAQVHGPRVVTIRLDPIVLHAAGDVDRLRRHAQGAVGGGVFLGLGQAEVEPGVDQR